MPITTPDDIEDKRYSPENTDAPEMEFDGREMSTIEALQIVDTEHAELWRVIEQIEEQIEKNQELRETVTRQQEQIERLEKTVKEMQGDMDTVAMRCHQCDRTIRMPWREPKRCPDCGERLAWDSLENRLRGK